MGNKLYVGNLSYATRDENLQQHFSEFGTVTSAKVMMDRDTGRSKGFGFVEMGSDEQAQAAIRGLNGQSVDGRALVVNEARPKEDRSGGFGGGNRGGYGGGRRDREMFSVTCSSCGNDALVPFQPRGDKPVYCSDCFSKQRGGGGGGYSRSYR